MARFAWIALLSFPGLVASISMASSSRRRKLLELDDLRRSLPRASQSAVHGLVAYLKKNGLPELYNRNDQREARDMKVTDKTAYGPIAQYLDLKPADPAGDNVPLLMAHPLAMIWKAYRECDAFAAFLDARLVAQPCTPDTPWKMILYGDEVHPGDVLGGNKARKFQAVYYSFLEFGLVALSNESLWFTLTTTRSSLVKKAAGGMAQVFGEVLKLLFVKADVKTIGFTLHRDGKVVYLYIELGFFVQDGSAHKFTWHCKGDAGSKLCLLCKNLFSEASEIADEDGEQQLRCNCTKYSELDLASSAELRGAVRELNALKLVEDPEAFKVSETVKGFVYQPYTMLADEELDDTVDVVAQFMHDWMHMLFVAGVWNLVVHLVLQAAHSQIPGNIYVLLGGFVEMWHWPAQVGANKLHELFTKDRQKGNVSTKHFRCSASQGLSLYSVIALFLQNTLEKEGKCLPEIKAYVALCSVIDVMMGIARDLVDENLILEAVETFLDYFDKAFGMAYSTPKFHWMLHFKDHFRTFEKLVSCWPLERKHKVPKAYATDVRNTQAYEQSVLYDVIAHHLHRLADPSTFAFMTLGLINPRPASNAVMRFVGKLLELPEGLNFDCKFALTCHPTNFLWVSVGDVVTFEEDGFIKVGEVWYLLTILDEMISVINEWEMVSVENGAVRCRLPGKPKLVFCENITYTVIWARYSATETKYLQPREYL